MVLLLRPETETLIREKCGTINSFVKKNNFNRTSFRKWIKCEKCIPAIRLFEIANALGVDAESISNYSKNIQILKGA